MDKEYGTTDEEIEKGWEGSSRCESCPNFIPCMKYEMNVGECPTPEEFLKYKKAMEEGCACCGGLPDIFGDCLAGCDDGL